MTEFAEIFGQGMADSARTRGASLVAEATGEAFAVSAVDVSRVGMQTQGGGFKVVEVIAFDALNTDAVAAALKVGSRVLYKGLRYEVRERVVQPDGPQLAFSGERLGTKNG